MGYGLVPDIHDEAVVCQSPCEHRDCAANRKMWGEGKCPYCKQGFEAGQKFYFEGEAPDQYPVHALCALEAAEKEKVQ